MTDQIVNIPLLRKAVEWAEAEAERTDSARNQWEVALADEASHCGTTFCVAGWTLFKAGWSVSQIARADDALDQAATLLGIPLWTAEESLKGDHLFDGQNTIADVRRIAEEIAACAGERL